MTSYLFLMIALLEKTGILLPEDAKKLASELSTTNIPDNYDGVRILLGKALEKLGISLD